MRARQPREEDQRRGRRGGKRPVLACEVQVCFSLAKPERVYQYLFAPYSAFTVVSAAWNLGTSLDPHVIELEAAVDNKEEPEDLPLAPWS